MNGYIETLARELAVAEVEWETFFRKYFRVCSLARDATTWPERRLLQKPKSKAILSKMYSVI
jgi:hypothetical protein